MFQPNNMGVVMTISRGRLWRPALALAALIAIACAAAFALNAPVAAESAAEGDVLFGSCVEGAGGAEGTVECVEVVEWVPGPEIMGLKAVQISAGSDHVYALKADGTLVGWGVSENGRLATPNLQVQRGNNVRAGRDALADVGIGADDRPTINEDGQQSAQSNRYQVDQEDVRWSAVAAGYLHTCAITTEGEVHCWGDNSRGQTDIPIGLLGREPTGEIPNPRFTKIVAGGYHTCVLEAEMTIPVAAMREGGADTIPAGSIVCWGDNSTNQIDVPGSPSGAHSDPLPNDPDAGLGGVAANANGDLGDENSSGMMYVDVTAGKNHTCAVRHSGLVDCWGSDSHGQIRVPMQLRDPQPAVITSRGLERSGVFHSVEAGENHTCAINREGGALCWGANTGSDGSLGAQEYPPAGEFTQLSAGRWHGCAIWTYDDFPLREVNPEAPEPAWVTNVMIDGALSHQVISLSPVGNMDCWGSDSGTGRTLPPTSVQRHTTDGRLAVIENPRWNQVSAGGTFTCGIFDLTPNNADAPPPANAEQAARFSATAAVSEGAVECWGMRPAENVPAPDKIPTRMDEVTRTVCNGEPAVAARGAVAELPDLGWGRIHGRVDADGTIQFAFRVVQAGPDIWINPQFRFVPREGNLTVGRWYYSEPMTVSAHADSAPGAELAYALNDVVPCDCQDLMVGRIAVRLLTSGHMQLSLMTPDGMVMANVPDNHDRIPNPAEPGKWWSTDFIKWRDVR